MPAHFRQQRILPVQTVACCQNSGTSIGLIGLRLRANYLLDSMEAIPTFEGGKRTAGRLPFYSVTKIDTLIVAIVHRAVRLVLPCIQTE